MVVKFEDVYKEYYQCEENTFPNVVQNFSSKFLEKAQSGKLSLIEMEQCYEEVRLNYECGYTTCMLWMNEYHDFQSMNEVLNMIEESITKKNKTKFPFYFSHDNSLHIPEFDNYAEGYETDEPEEYEYDNCEICQINISQKQSFMNNVNTKKFVYHIVNEGLKEECNEHDYRFEYTHYAYFKFGQYYIFIINLDH